EIAFAVDDDVLNVFSTQFPRQSITAQQHQIILSQMNLAYYRRHFTLRAQRLQNHVTKHVRLGFRLTDLTNINQLLHERLVLGRETTLVLANNVAAAVADLHEVECIATNSCAGERRAHTRAT